jgi:uncharacterized membrane protein YdbT with pleckstrin-like domain
MGYAQQTLSSGEKIVYAGKLHWIVFVGAAIWFCFLFFPGILIFLTRDDFNDAFEIPFDGGMAIAIPLIFIATLFLLSTLITYLSSEFVITTKRIVIRTGFIRRKALDILLSKVESVEVKQDILERILNYGEVILCGTGGTKSRFKNIANPLQFRMKVQEQIDTPRDTVAT